MIAKVGRRFGSLGGHALLALLASVCEVHKAIRRQVVLLGLYAAVGRAFDDGSGWIGLNADVGGGVWGWALCFCSVGLAYPLQSTLKVLILLDSCVD